MALARRLTGGSSSSSWAFVEQDGTKPLIVNAEFIDPLTMNRPFANRTSDAILILAAIRPERFLEMKRTLESEYRARVEIADRPMAETGAFSAVVELGPGVFARLTPDVSYFADRTRGLKASLLLGALVMSLLSISLLMALIRRFITKPIARLDRQLTEVLAGERTEIAIASEAGEIGSLSSNMKTLHEDVVRSLNGIQKASWTDTLTGISNRAHFNVLAADAIEAARRNGSRCGLLFIDVDNFKFVNDRYGHEVGDELLKTLAGRFAEVVRHIAERDGVANTVFARLSGDEFAVIVESLEASTAADDVAAGILAIFASGFDERFPVGVSIGVASSPETAANLTQLLANADAAMYQAKSGGKNRSARFSREIQDKRVRDRTIQDELQRLDPDEEFRLVYMPIVDPRDRVIACEALIRWTSPTLGVMTPDEFIPIAERNGLFSSLDRWVIDKALCDHAKLAEWFGADVIVSINVSSAELHATSLRDYLVERLTARRVAPAQVEIELTETFAVGLHAEISRNVRAFREAGVRIAIDDFGAGYTSIQQVTEYSADTIKLDRAFAERLTSSPATLSALVALCHAQGMSIVAEGVDRSEKVDLFRAVGCDGLQGFEICPPLPLNDLGLWALARLAPSAAPRDRTVSKRIA